MKKYVLVFTGLVLAGCVGVSPEQCNDYATQLKNSNDVIQVLNSYISYRDGAAEYNYNGTKKKSESIERSCWDDFLRRQDVKYICLNEENTSDECILYRRNNKHESELAFFNFKYFLPDNSKIQTETDFKTVLEYYESNIKKCEELTEKTIAEKQDCKDSVINNVRNFSINGAKTCKKSFSKEYQDFLKEKGDWYVWAINHDPWELYREWRAMTGIDLGAGASGMYQRVYSKTDALIEIKENIEVWGKEHLCDTTGWQAEIRKMGYKLN